VQKYAQDIMMTQTTLLKQGIQNNQQMLLQEVLGLISTMARILESVFALFYNTLMPMMIEILTNVQATDAEKM
jgi:hypothetical protein